MSKTHAQRSQSGSGTATSELYLGIRTSIHVYVSVHILDISSLGRAATWISPQRASLPRFPKLSSAAAWLVLGGSSDSSCIEIYEARTSTSELQRYKRYRNKIVLQVKVIIQRKNLGKICLREKKATDTELRAFRATEFGSNSLSQKLDCKIC
uniref:Uncharacterized protein n=1 Tax=Trichogramma kaykai TaxID=54128 RepID=A0ABD2X9N0_9HYME